MKKQQILCDTCKNRFVTKVLLYKKHDSEMFPYIETYQINASYIKKEELKNFNLNELRIEEEFCIYTRNRGYAKECSFYNSNIDISKLYKKETLPDFDDDYQDINRTYTNNERASSGRIDCSIEA